MKRSNLPLRFFLLLEYSRAMELFIDTAITEVKNRQYPLLAKIETVQVENLAHTRSTMPSGRVVDSQPIECKLEFPIDLKDAIAGDANSLLASIAGAAEQKGRFEMQSLLQFADRITEGAGTSFHAQGRPISRSVILESFRNLQIDFDDDERPILPSEVRHLFHAPTQTCTCFTDGKSSDFVVVTSQTMMEQIARLPPPTDEEMNAFRELIEKKKAEHDDRRRYRQLS